MKTSLKIFLLAVALAVMPACSAQKRAERHLRKAVALCPELVQVKAHPIDTVLTAPGYADCALFPMSEVLKKTTIYAPTDHGTVIVKLLPDDSTLRVGFVAAPIPVHYQDTISYAQVVAPEGIEKYSGGNAWIWIGCILLGIVIGFVALIWIALKVKIVE
jgi:hypothetical protein